MTNLWEEVEYNEQLEQKFDDVVEHLKLSKQKGYKMNFDLSEKLKTIDTTIQELLKEQTKERKYMTKIISPVQYLKITCVYKSYSLEITKEEDSEYFKCELIGNVFSKPRKITNESLEIVLAFFKSHVDNFNTGYSDPLMLLTIKCGDRTLNDVKYDPNINKVLSNFLFLTKKGEEGSLDKLVVSFQEDVEKESKSYVYKKREVDNEMVKVGTLLESGYIEFDIPKHKSYYTTFGLSNKYYLNWYIKKENHYLEVIPNTTPSRVKSYNFRELLCPKDNNKTIGYFTEDNNIFYYDQFIKPDKN